MLDWYKTLKDIQDMIGSNWKFAIGPANGQIGIVATRDFGTTFESSGDTVHAAYQDIKEQIESEENNG
jgi:hypothetical protein